MGKELCASVIFLYIYGEKFNVGSTRDQRPAAEAARSTQPRENTASIFEKTISPASRQRGAGHNLEIGALNNKARQSFSANFHTISENEKKEKQEQGR